jgi:stringent starvation protein B
MSLQPLPPKKEVALALLERSSVHVHLDPRATGVVVPPWFKRQPQLVLQVGLNMPVPIPDLRLDEEGLGCTLSFNRSPFYCVVPWTSVFAMVGDDGRGMVWPDDVPSEIAKPAPLREEPARSPVAAVPAMSKGSAPAPQAITSPRTPRKNEKRAAASSDGKAAKLKTKKPTRTKRGRSSADASDASTRPILVAVPEPMPPPVSMAERRSAAADGEKRASEEKPRRAPPSNKPKREIPPYLRVVK